MPTGIPKNGINASWFKKGQLAYNKGIKCPERSGENSPTWKGGEIKLHCILCGKEYYKERCSVYRSKFCSRSCRARYYFTGEKNPNWKGNIRKSRDKLKCSILYANWRLKVFQRDRFTCKYCGYRSKESKAHGNKTSDIHAHHIKTLEKYPRLCLKVGNGITLCKNCHRLTYSKEELFAKVFKEILNDYMLNKAKA